MSRAPVTSAVAAMLVLTAGCQSSGDDGDGAGASSFEPTFS